MSEQSPDIGELRPSQGQDMRWFADRVMARLPIEYHPEDELDDEAVVLFVGAAYGAYREKYPKPGLRIEHALNCALGMTIEESRADITLRYPEATKREVSEATTLLGDQAYVWFHIATSIIAEAKGEPYPQKDPESAERVSLEDAILVMHNTNLLSRPMAQVLLYVCGLRDPTVSIAIAERVVTEHGTKICNMIERLLTNMDGPQPTTIRALKRLYSLFADNSPHMITLHTYDELVDEYHRSRGGKETYAKAKRHVDDDLILAIQMIVPRLANRRYDNTKRTS